MSGVQCAECGRFLGEADFAAGRVYYEPESEFGHERIEWACRRHGFPTRAAQVDRNPKGHDRADGHGAKHESPVANGDALQAHNQGGDA